MDKILEAIIFLPERSARSKQKMLLKIMETSTFPELTTETVVNIFEMCTKMIINLEPKNIRQLALFIYRHFGKKYTLIFKNYFLCLKKLSLMSRKCLSLNQRFLWLKESLILLKDEHEELKKIKPVS